VELECLRGPDDLQLAAELGKTLLERNKELEGNLRDHQSVIEDQSQEIEYLTKQTSTLREVNDSRVKIYEQLEVSISDLETTNKKLMEENLTDKVKIKSLCENIGKLENRCEELQRLLEEARTMLEKQQQLQKRRRERQKSSQSSRGSTFDVVPDQISGSEPSGSESNSSRPSRPNSPKNLSDTESERTGSRTQEVSSGYSSSSIESHLHRLDQSDSEMSSPDREKPPKSDVDPDLNLEDELLEASDQITKIDKLEVVEERLHEMEKVVVSLQTENRRLQTIFASTTVENVVRLESSSSSMHDSFRSVDDELEDVQDVRRGKLCRKCLNVVDATPANLIGTAFQMMGETANQELQRVFWNWQKDELRLRSRNDWLDLWFLAVCFFALAISLCSSLTQLRCCT